MVLKALDFLEVSTTIGFEGRGNVAAAVSRRLG
jgi:hypothetical protein